MSLAQILSTFASLNLSIILAFCALRGSRALLTWLSREPSAQSELRLHYRVLVAVFIITAAQPFLPKSALFEPAVKVWSSHSIKSFSNDAPDRGGFISIPTIGGTSTIEGDQISRSLWVISIVILFFGALLFVRDFRSLLKIRRQSYRVKRIGHVSVFTNDEIAVPFSYWVPGQSDIVIPSFLTRNFNDYQIAVAHEIQHHRQRDTRWVYVIWVLKMICVLNPFIFLWSRWISEIQEFACDATLVDRKKVESQQYARCLVEVARTALNRKYVPACATGLIFLVERKLLKRRIEKMMSANKTKRSISGAIGVMVVALIAATAFASQGWVQDRRVSLAQAQKWAAQAKNSEFPVVVNDLVVKQLNRYIGTPEGRNFMRKALRNLETYRALVEKNIHDYQVPTELMAIPIIESGYQNLEQSDNPDWGAGIWMFIASTARRYGLRVNEKVDERLNEALLTDAAMRYLKGDRLQFNDWQLSVLSYAHGENKVHEGIQKTGSRDAWVLIRKGYISENYLPRLMAAILIMRNPESVE